MPESLKDGTGRGFLASVNPENQLAVKAINVPNIHYRTVAHGDVYLLNFWAVMAAAETEEYAGWFMYTGSRTCILQKVFVSTQDRDRTVATITAGPILSGGATIDPVNLNTTSSKILQCNMYHNNAMSNPFTEVQAGGPLMMLCLEGASTYEMYAMDAFVIQPNIPIGIKVKTTSQYSLVSCHTIAYEMDEV